MPSYSCFVRIVSCFIQVVTADIHSRLRTEHHSGDVWHRKAYQYACVTAFSSVASGMDTKVKSTQSGLKQWLRLCDHYLVAHN